MKNTLDIAAFWLGLAVVDLEFGSGEYTEYTERIALGIGFLKKAS
jgi:hypothetical protein